MTTTLLADDLRRYSDRLRAADRRLAAPWPGESGDRQPVHTVFGGAHLFTAEVAVKLGKIALAALDTYAPDPLSLARILGLPGAERLPEAGSEADRLIEALAKDPEALRDTNRAAWLAAAVHGRVRRKLEGQPVEDYRIDFEDGFGNRSDDEEDAYAEKAAAEVARGLEGGTLPPFIGIRIKPLSEDLHRRSIRTLDVFVTTLRQSGARLVPADFVVTLPKVTAPEHVAVLASALAELEKRTGLAQGSLKIELLIEKPQAIVAPDGLCGLPSLAAAGEGRCVSAHFGSYDYTADCGVAAAHQHTHHPTCAFAKHMMQAAYAGTGVRLADGATPVLPIPPHRSAAGGPALTPGQIGENTAVVHRAWRLHYANVQRSLADGFYQGCDLHPAQFPARYAAVYVFFIDGLDAATPRLRHFIAHSARATLVGDVFDAAATGQGLLNFFLRALNCGAVAEDEVTSLTGLTVEELRSRSFLEIIERRRAASGAQSADPFATHHGWYSHRPSDKGRDPR